VQQVQGGVHVRLCAWNVKGRLPLLETCTEAMDLLSGYDAVVLSETGAEQSGAGRYSLPGFWCVLNAARARRSVQGGVAVFVRRDWRKYVKVVQGRREVEGVAWVRIALPGAQLLHLAACYLPPEDSSIRGSTRAERGAKMIEEWGHLQEAAAGFQEVGMVVVAGDLNARTGVMPDWRPHAWEEPGMEGLAPPTRNVALPSRANEDALVAGNAQGRCLLQFCNATGLAIMNGRLPGDVSGAVTFVAATGRSLVDYFVASPELAFQPGGMPHDGCDLWVLRAEDRPTMPGLQTSFDHSPVFFTCLVPPNRARAGGGDRGGSRHGSRVKVVWEESMQRDYSECVSAGLNGLVDRIRDAEDVQGACAVLEAAISQAIDGLEVMGHRPRKRTGGFPAGYTPKPNSWFNDSVRQALRRRATALAQSGRRSREYRDACAAVDRAVRMAKREQAEREMEARVNGYYQSPRRFWSGYKQGKMSGPYDEDVTGWTEYYSTLYQQQGQGQYTGGSLGSHLEAHKGIFESVSGSGRAGALEAGITAEEVCRAMGMLANNKSTGPDGLPGEFLSQAWVEVGEGLNKRKARLLAGPLACLFSRVFSEGYPPEWGTCALTSVPKPKGDPRNRDDYRGIAVSSALSKLYSLVLLSRLDAWAEREGRRAAGQAGFRKERCAMDNALVLQHVFGKHAAEGRPVYAAFIDLRKAYDWVDRGVLWHALSCMGIPDGMMRALQGMYANVNMRVRAGGKLGDPFPAVRGVRQGDPLSPLLFGLFIDQLEGFLRQRCGEYGAMVGDLSGAARLVRLLLYADDLVLLAHTPQQLQALLDQLHVFCQGTMLTVNVAKSVVMVGGRAAEAPVFTYDGKQMPQVARFVYLGVPFVASGVDLDYPKQAAQRAAAASHVVNARCVQLRLFHASVRCNLFNTLVMPVLSYGCEIWGPFQLKDLMSRPGAWGAKGAAEQVHKDFLHRTLGVKACAPVAAVMAVTGREPIAHAWLRRLLRFWNGIVKRPEDDMVRAALACNASAAEVLRGRGGTASWASAVRTVVHALDQNASALVTTASELPGGDLIKKAGELWMETVWKGVLSEEQEVEGDPVRSCPDSGVRANNGYKLRTYKHWFYTPFQVGCGYVYYLLRQQQIHAISRLFLGAHDFEVERGRFRGGVRQQRAARVCKCCDMGTVEDEMHVLLECPAWEQLRVLTGLFTHDIGGPPSKERMCAITRCGNDAVRWRQLADFVIRVEAMRKVMYRENAW
jgi:hypothetical protein